MRSAVVLSFLSAVALGAPTPNPLRIGSESPGSEHKRSPANPNVDDSKFSIGLGIPAVVVDGHPIKIPHVKRDPADDVDDSKFSIGSHSIITGGPAVSIDGHAKGGSVGNDPGSSIHILIRDPEPNLAKKRSAEIITGASAIGFGTSATGGSVSLSGDSKGKDGACKNGKHGKDGKDGKDGTEGAGIANLMFKQGGNGGDALVPGSRAGNGGNGGIIINP
ncbi:hypothetical protein COCCADRAFT_27504 [Bipolaris zeicola 26-R-13]|uniref:Uncharacterized protein n=1 Tax=Cochliobolus carbonum (strain 26-R-13) TaxID=930089 RepID=W6Y1W0_COCC2|nr:uncharacterized protein COCCADRAFT_27504 [Bipolaris zeicola 26-R-13]EUC31893.1 hypothetical protein COCCADRAFT_27504 [Bipolaris zeicola 26-R-13]